ncbi:MAG: hypothetical protein MUC48_27705 [Leptolyngbya sp. Prado105]|jgi:hypothetical protein|nr:hypothetical protein [Leptolyngbya sp. Prado105]
MIGLSTTAIGMRPIESAIEIYYQLQDPLRLEYLELAIGTYNDLSVIPPEIPIVIHDRALYQGNQRLPFSLMQPRSWMAYRALIQQRLVLALSIHPPRLQSATPQQIQAARSQLEAFLEIPVLLEVMPSDEYHNSKNLIVPEVPLLLDVSHVNIWHQGNAEAVKQTVEELLPLAQGIHLSHNNGKSDSHDLIPTDIWFNPLINEWGRSLLVTYESLPEAHYTFERMDKCSKKKALLEKQRWSFAN